MSNRQGSRTERIEAQRRRAAEALKRCPLCDAINAMSNEECFVCTWHGEFNHDPDNVEAGLGELLDRCPELADAMMTPVADSQENARMGRWSVFCGALRSFFSRRTTSGFFDRRSA